MGKASRSKQERLAAINYKPDTNFSWFPVLISLTAVVAVVGIVFVTIFANNKALEPSVAPTSSVTIPADIKTTIDKETGAITIGEAATNLTEYFDFGCPFCGEYFQKNAEIVRGFVSDKDLTLILQPLGMLDNAFQGTKFSTRAANALYCVAEKAPNATLDFVANMYENQPKEGTKGLDDAKIIKIANTSGAEDAASCIEDGTYNQFVADKTKPIITAEWFTGTPMLRINGKIVDANASEGILETTIQEAKN